MDIHGPANYFRASFWPWPIHILWKTNLSILMNGQAKACFSNPCCRSAYKNSCTEFQRNHHLHWGKVFAPDEITVRYTPFFSNSGRCLSFCIRFHGTRRIAKKFSSRSAFSESWLNQHWTLWRACLNQACLNEAGYRSFHSWFSLGIIRDAVWRSDFCRSVIILYSIYYSLIFRM